MKNSSAPAKANPRHPLAMACATAVGVALFTFGLPPSAYAASIRPPAVPANIQVPAGNKPYLIGHAEGTQNYVCLPSGTSVKFTLFTPQATLFTDEHKEISTHYFSPNPTESGTIRAAWQHSRDTSMAWGKVLPEEMSTDSAYVAPGAIAWFLIRVVGTHDGPTGGDMFSKATFLQRVNTSGGRAPSAGCASAEDLGKQAFVPYTADYVFYTSQ